MFQPNHDNKSTIPLYPGSAREHLTGGASSLNARRSLLEGIPTQSAGTIKYVLLLGILVISVTNIPAAEAHKVQTATDVGATLHIEPNDNPRAQEPAKAWFALTRKGGKVIPLAECNCQLAVYSEPHKPGERPLLVPSLKPLTAERYQGIPGAEITFPKPGAYQLQLSGKPVTKGSFQPFELKFAVTVAAPVSTPKRE